MIPKTIKFNENLYSLASIKQAVYEYQKKVGQKNSFKLKTNRPYFEIEIGNEKYPNNLIEEFCNYVLYLNLK